MVDRVAKQLPKNKAQQKLLEKAGITQNQKNDATAQVSQKAPMQAQSQPSKSSEEPQKTVQSMRKPQYMKVQINIWEFLKMFLPFYFLIFIPIVAVFEETRRPGAIINNLIRKHIYGQGNLHDYMADDPLNQPYDDEIPLCDYKTMTPKQFFHEYVRTGRPCLFPEYGKEQPAYHKWSNETYLREVAGDEIIFAERQTNNRFAYFTDGAKRVYLTFSEFLDAFKVKDRVYHYYYSFAEPPGKLNEDISLPPLMDALFLVEKVTYWHGYGTLTRPHTDAMENMNCVFEGYKNFTIVAPMDRKYIYAGTEGYPDNYSPVEFVAPDYDKYPDLKKARIKTVHIKPGDCLYIPAYYWHQVGSSPEVSIAVATFFKTYHQIVDLYQIGFQQKTI